MTAVQTNSNSMTSASSKSSTLVEGVNPQQVGWLFVQQYYTFLNQSPERLHLFYNSNSVWIHGREADGCPTVKGQKAIKDAIAALNFYECQVFISSVDSQASMNGGVIVQVLGELSNNYSVCHKFSQTFFLAQQPDGYYVLNDIFRFLKEDIEANGDAWDANNSSINGTAQQQENLVFNYQEKAPVAAVAPVQPKTASPQRPPQAPAPAAVKEAEKKPAVAEAPTAAKPSAPVKEEPKPVAAEPTVPDQKPVVPSTQSQPKKAAPVAPVSVSQPQSDVSKAQKPPSPVKKQAPSWSRVVSSPSESPQPGLSNPAVQSAAASSNPAPAAAPQVSSSQPGSASSSQASSRQNSLKPQHKKANKEDNQVSNDGFQNVPSRQRTDRRPLEEKEKSTIFLRTVPDYVEKRSLHEAFDAFGNVLHVDMIPTKQMAFVTFKSPDQAQSCIGKQVVVVCGNGKTVTLLAEERKKGGHHVNGNGSGAGGRGGAAGYRGRGRGGKGSH